MDAILIASGKEKQTQLPANLKDTVYATLKCSGYNCKEERREALMGGERLLPPVFRPAAETMLTI
jgi:hypothetical protein